MLDQSKPAVIPSPSPDYTEHYNNDLNIIENKYITDFKPCMDEKVLLLAYMKNWQVFLEEPGLKASHDSY